MLAGPPGRPLQLVVALAASAALAIENARLYQDSERRRHWRVTSTVATQVLLAGTEQHPLDVVLTHAMTGAYGDLALLGLLGADATATIDRVVGALAGDLAGQQTQLEDSVAESVFLDGRPVPVHDYAGSAATRPLAPAAQRIASVIAVPLHSDDLVEGAFAVCRLTGRKPFDQTDLDQLADFADHAAIAIQLDRARGVQQDRPRQRPCGCGSSSTAGRCPSRPRPKVAAGWSGVRSSPDGQAFAAGPSASGGSSSAAAIRSRNEQMVRCPASISPGDRGSAPAQRVGR
jgi:GAF domain-containing protein